MHENIHIQRTETNNRMQSRNSRSRWNLLGSITIHRRTWGAVDSGRNESVIHSEYLREANCVRTRGRAAHDTARDWIGIGELAGRVTRGAPLGSPRQASPTNSRQRVRSRPADWVRSRWESADRNAVPRYSIPWSHVSRSRSSSCVGRCRRDDDNDDTVVDEKSRCRMIADNTCEIFKNVDRQVKPELIMRLIFNHAIIYREDSWETESNAKVKKNLLQNRNTLNLYIK